MEDVSQGQERVRAWPRKRGRAKTTAERKRQDKFTAAQFAIKYMAPQIAVAFREACKNTPLMPRDLLTSMLYGRLAMFVMEDGRKLWPKQAMNDVSEALDTITQTPGDYLRRTEQGWIGVGGGGGGGGGFSRTTLYRAAAGNLTNIGFQKIPYDAASIDQAGWADLPNNCVKPNIAGTYIVIVRVRTNSAGPTVLFIGKNNALELAISDDTGAPHIAYHGVGLATVDGVSDTIEGWCYCGSSRALTPGTVDTYIDVIGPIGA